MSLAEHTEFLSFPCSVKVFSSGRILYCIHTKKLSCLKSGVEFDMNDILYEFKDLHHFKDSLTFGVKAR